MMKMKTTWLMVAAALAMGGCMGEVDGELEAAEQETTEFGYVRAIAYPALRDWSPWTRASFFREATNRPTLVLTPYQNSKYFVAYGVDARRGNMVFAYRVQIRHYGSFMNGISNQWQEMSNGFSDFNSLIRGVFKKPAPIGPPVGNPPNQKFGGLIVDAAMQGQAADDVLAADLAHAQ